MTDHVPLRTKKYRVMTTDGSANEVEAAMSPDKCNVWWRATFEGNEIVLAVRHIVGWSEVTT